MGTIEQTTATVQSMLDLHITSGCCKAKRGEKEKGRQICINDTMLAVQDVALAVLEEFAGPLAVRVIYENTKARILAGNPAEGGARKD